MNRFLSLGAVLALSLTMLAGCDIFGPGPEERDEPSSEPPPPKTEKVSEAPTESRGTPVDPYVLDR